MQTASRRPREPGGESSPERVSILVASAVYTPEVIAGPAAVAIAGSQIRGVWRDTDATSAMQRARQEWPNAAVDVTDLGDWSLAPGYIDLHDHGFAGHDVTTGTREDIEAMARALPRTGVTAFLPTIATTGREETRRQILRCVEVATSQARDDKPAAEILGIRLEGPFISPVKKGAQFAPAIRRPDPAEMRELAALGAGWICMVDYAPEEDEGGRLLATLIQIGIIASIGHTNATYEQTMVALDGGARHCTHLFNAMSSLGHRAPGAPGALLTDRRPTVEIIADGIHLAPAVLRLTVEARGPAETALITDAVAAAGLAEGAYEFIGRTVTVAEGAVRLPDGTLAGSALTMERAVRNIVTYAGSSRAEAIRMATRTPADIIGVGARKGRLAPGADADLVALDAAGCVQRTWTRGCPAYDAATAPPEAGGAGNRPSRAGREVLTNP